MPLIDPKEYFLTISTYHMQVDGWINVVRNRSSAGITFAVLDNGRVTATGAKDASSIFGARTLGGAMPPIFFINRCIFICLEFRTDVQSRFMFSHQQGSRISVSPHRRMATVRSHGSGISTIPADPGVLLFLPRFSEEESI